MDQFFFLSVHLAASHCLFAPGDFSQEGGVWDGLWKGRPDEGARHAGQDGRSQASYRPDQQDGRPHRQLEPGEVLIHTSCWGSASSVCCVLRCEHVFHHVHCCPAGMKSVRRSWCPFWKRWASTPRRTSTSCRAQGSQVPTSRSPSPSAPGTRKSALTIRHLIVLVWMSIS